MPIGQVDIRFYLPNLMFYLPRAGGQCLMLSPGGYIDVLFTMSYIISHSRWGWGVHGCSLYHDIYHLTESV